LVVLCVANQSWFQYCQVPLPWSLFVPLLVNIAMFAPLECPLEASKPAVSTLISDTVSAYGRYPTRRDGPRFGTPSSENSLPPTPPAAFTAEAPTFEWRPR
jgi:hypothetical protein